MGRKTFAGAGGGDRRLVVARGIAPGEDAPGVIARAARVLHHPLRLRSGTGVHQVVGDLRDMFRYAVRVQALQCSRDLKMEPLPSSDTGYSVGDALYERVGESKSVAFADQESLLDALLQRVSKVLFGQLPHFKQ